MVSPLPAPNLPLCSLGMPERVIDISEITLDPDNANRGNPAGGELLLRSIRNNGAGRGILLDKHHNAIAGNQVIKAAVAAGIRKIRVVEAAPDELVATVRADVDLDSPKGRQLALDDNGIGRVSQDLDVEVITRHAARYDLSLEDAGFNPSILAAMRAAAAEPVPAGAESSGGQMEIGERAIDPEGPAPTSPSPAGGDGAAPRGPTLAERFTAPPFTVLDSRQGYWQDRKRQWLALGLRSELGREGTDATAVGRRFTQDDAKVDAWLAAQSGLSIFDPVLAECVCRWFTRPGDVCLDVCAGGAVRGIVAVKCGLQYIGIEPRAEQIEANRQQAERICGEGDHPTWLRGYAQELLHAGLIEPVDFVFTCPPYWNLEEYSTDPRDLSAMSWGDFLDTWAEIIRQAMALLKPGRFAAVVVGELRGADGTLLDFVGKTKTFFEWAGGKLYNDGVFLTPVGSLPVRVGQAFQSGRKLGRCHQYCLVFYKGGSTRQIRDEFPAEVPGADLSMMASEVEAG